MFLATTMDEIATAYLVNCSFIS